MSISMPIAAGLHALVVAAAILALGYLLADFLMRGNAIDSVALALPSAVLFGLLLMVAHMSLGGTVFSHALPVGLPAGAVASALVARILWRRRKRVKHEPLDGASGADSRRSVYAAATVALIGVVVWGIPAFRAIPLPTLFEVDMYRHAGYAAQLMNGHPVPAPPLTTSFPNDYPWMYHVFLAFLARLSPTGKAIGGLAPLHLITVVGSSLSLFSLGRQITGRWTTGVATSIYGAISGGFGFLLLDHLDVITFPRMDTLKYMGDLMIVRSYNGAFGNIVPPYPRDLAYALLPALLLLLIQGLETRSTRRFVGVGVILALLGLTGGEAFFVGTGITVVAWTYGAVSRRLSAITTAIAILVPTFLLYALWLVPFVINYLRYGARSYAVGLVELPPHAILMTWGIVTPLALLGVFVWLLGQRRSRSDHSPLAREEAGRWIPGVVLLAFAIVGGALIVVPGLLIGSTPAFKTLGFAHRYWPLFYLAVAIFAGLGASYAFGRMFDSRPPMMKVAAGVFALAVLAPAIASPLVASAAAPRELANPLFTSALTGDQDNVLSSITNSTDDSCVVAVPPFLTDSVFAYTGYDFVSYASIQKGQVNLFGGFSRFPVLERGMRQKLGAATVSLLTLDGSADRWQAAAREHDVDIVVVAAEGRSPSDYEDYRTELVDGGPQEVLVIHRTSCGMR